MNAPQPSTPCCARCESCEMVDSYSLEFPTGLYEMQLCYDCRTNYYSAYKQTTNYLEEDEEPAKEEVEFDWVPIQITEIESQIKRYKKEIKQTPRLEKKLTPMIKMLRDRIKELRTPCIDSY